MQQLKQVGWGSKPHTINSMKDKTQLPSSHLCQISWQIFIFGLNQFFVGSFMRTVSSSYIFRNPEPEGGSFDSESMEELELESENWQRNRGLSWNQGSSISTIFKNLELEAINKIWELHNNGLNFLHYILPQISLALS